MLVLFLFSFNCFHIETFLGVKIQEFWVAQTEAMQLLIEIHPKRMYFHEKPANFSPGEVTHTVALLSLNSYFKRIVVAVVVVAVVLHISIVTGN